MRSETSTGRGSTGQERGSTFLSEPPPSADLDRLFDADVEQQGYVMNASRAWGHQPALQLGLFDLLDEATASGGITFRQRGILVAAVASTLGDAYCSLAWGNRLATEVGADVAASVLQGDDGELDPAEQVLAGWARRVARDATGTTEQDVQALRSAGFADAAIVAITTYVALRMAFSTVNGALGARPDRQLVIAASPAVRDAVTYGRPPASEPSPGVPPVR